MLLPSPDINQQLHHLLPGDHLAALYESRSEWRSSVMPFLQTGLEMGQKVICLAGSRDFGYLARQYAPIIDPALKSGQLLLLDANSFKNKYKNPSSHIIETLNSYMQNSGTVRFSLDWMFKFYPPEQLQQFEAMLHNFIHESGAILFCQYNLKHLESSTAKAVLESHPQVVRGNTLCQNIYYIPSDIIVSDHKPDYEVIHWLDAIYTEDKTRRETKYLAEVESDLCRKLELERLISSIFKSFYKY